MSGSEADLTLILKAKNLASREVDKLHGALGRLQGGVRNVGGALATLTKVGVAGLAVGLTAVVGFLGMATHAAAEEQKGIAQLDAALRANVKGYNGNTTAIEAVIAKREDLAFSDDALRASLVTLVAKYKDSDKALRLQATAMDIARLKGVSLDEATGMLTKGLDGNAKILKTLGITLPKTATEQQRLTAIQKVAAGQAAAYGKTAVGAQEAFQIALGDTVEDIGGAFLPIMTAAFTWLRQKALPAVRDMIGRIQGWLAANKPLVDQVKAFVGQTLQGFVTVLGRVFTWIGNVAGVMWGGGHGPLAVALGLAGKAFGIISGNVGFLIGKVADLIGVVQDAIAWLDKLNGKSVNKFEGGSGYRSPTASNTHGAVPRAAGGWAGLHGPEFTMLGERGPEYVASTSELRRSASSPNYELVAVSKKDLARMVDEQLYFTLRRAAPTSGRV